MKKIFVLATLISFALGMPLAAHAQFGGLLGGAKTNGKASGDVDGFIKTAEEADGLIRTSSDTLFKAVATKEQIVAHEDTMKAANAIADAKEQEAAIKKAKADQQAVLAKVDYKAKAEEMKAGMDEKQKAQVSVAIYNFMLGMLKDKEVLERGQGIIASISSNPMAITKLIKAKDVIASLSSQMGNITNVASGIQKLVTVVKLDDMPKSASDKSKAVTGD